MAGLTFTVAAPGCFDIRRLLPSFAGFETAPAAGTEREATAEAEAEATVEAEAEATAGARQTAKAEQSTGTATGTKKAAAAELFRFELQAEPLEVPAAGGPVEEDHNDMGHTRLTRTADGYCLQTSYTHAPGGSIFKNGSSDDSAGSSGESTGGAAPRDEGIFITDGRFSKITASVPPEAPDCGSLLSSMLRIAFSQAILRRDGISIHASAVAADGKAWLFLGKSGTGKSTHARLWLRNVPGSHLINDDNPAVRIVDGTPFAYGTPWSGKTPCYRNESHPVGGFTRLIQAGENIFTEKKDLDAFIAVLPSCSAIHSDQGLQSLLCDTLARLAGLVKVAELRCLPDDAAALLCHGRLTDNKI